MATAGKPLTARELAAIVGSLVGDAQYPVMFKDDDTGEMFIPQHCLGFRIAELVQDADPEDGFLPGHPEVLLIHMTKEDPDD